MKRREKTRKFDKIHTQHVLGIYYIVAQLISFFKNRTNSTHRNEHFEFITCYSILCDRLINLISRACENRFKNKTNDDDNLKPG